MPRLISFRALTLFAPILFCLGTAKPTAVAQAAQTKQSPSPSPEQQALDLYFKAGVQAYQRSNPSAAIKAFELGLEKAQALKNEPSTALFLNGLGVVYDKSGQFEKALDYFERALTVEEKVGNQPEIAVCLNNLGSVHRSRGQFEKALDFENRALTIQEKFGSPQGVTSALNNLGNTYEAIGQFEKSLDFHNRALTIREKLGDQQGIASSLTNLGNAYNSVGRFRKAVECHKRALAIQEKLGNQQEIAATLNNLGNVSRSLGQFENALELHDRALTIREKLGNQQEIAASLNGLGHVYTSLGQTEKALEYLNRALEIEEKLGNQQNIARTLNSLGAVYNSVGRFQMAADHFSRALTLQEKLGNQQDVAVSFNNLGVVYNSLRQYDKALENHNRALAVEEKLRNQQDLARSLNNIGAAYYGLGQFQKALECHNRALGLEERLGNLPDVAASLNNLGVNSESLHRFSDALSFYQRAIRTYESASRQAGDPAQFGLFQQANSRNIYARYANLLVRMGRSEEALAMVDRGRAQGLARQLNENSDALERRLRPEDARQFEALRSQFAAASNAVTTLRLLSVAESEEARPEALKREEEARDQLKSAERALETFRAQLFHRYPQYAGLAGFQPPTPAQFRELARANPDTLYLEYAVIDDKSALVFALSKQEGVKAFPLPVGSAELTRIVTQWRRTLAPGESGDRRLTLEEQKPTAALADDKPLSEQSAAKSLYSLLLGKVESARLLSRAGRLVVVADGPLLDIPFAALLDANGKRLVERLPVSTAFSLGSLNWSDVKRQPAGSFFCMAAPEGKDEKIVSRSRGNFVALAFASTEAHRLLDLFPDGEGLFGPAATKTAVMREMIRYQYLHFATHGMADGVHGMNSCLLVARDAEETNETAFLEAQDIAGMRLSAKLAVLSACQTAQGQRSGGEGLQGLAWAFRAAGCPAIVASQWSVDDEATGLLMVKFYRGLKAGRRKDDALREAMLSLGKLRPDPRFWAPFEIIGDCR